MDNSKHMLKKAAEAAPGTRLIKADLNEISSYPEGKYSHILHKIFVVHFLTQTYDINIAFKIFSLISKT